MFFVTKKKFQALEMQVQNLNSKLNVLTHDFEYLVSRFNRPENEKLMQKYTKLAGAPHPFRLSDCANVIYNTGTGEEYSPIIFEVEFVHPLLLLKEQQKQEQEQEAKKSKKARKGATRS